MYVIGAFVPQLISSAAEKGVADLINTSSIGAQNIFPNFAVYAGTKAYVTHMSRTLRAELGAKGVRVSAIEPGIVETELADHVTDAGATEWIAETKGQIEVLESEDVAEAINFLASQPAAGQLPAAHDHADRAGLVTDQRTVSSVGLMGRGMNRLDRFFEISARGSTVATEMRGGVVTFIAMAYIVVLNPIILSGAEDVDGQQARVRPGLGRDVAGRRRHDDPVRRHRAAAVRVRRRPRHQLVPRDDRRRLAHLARGDGPGRHQRAHHRAAGGDRVCAG